MHNLCCFLVESVYYNCAFIAKSVLSLSMHIYVEKKLPKISNLEKKWQKSGMRMLSNYILCLISPKIFSTLTQESCLAPLGSPAEANMSAESPFALSLLQSYISFHTFATIHRISIRYDMQKVVHKATKASFCTTFTQDHFKHIEWDTHWTNWTLDTLSSDHMWRMWHLKPHKTHLTSLDLFDWWILCQITLI